MARKKAKKAAVRKSRKAPAKTIPLMEQWSGYVFVDREGKPPRTRNCAFEGKCDVPTALTVPVIVTDARATIQHPSDAAIERVRELCEGYDTRLCRAILATLPTKKGERK